MLSVPKFGNQVQNINSATTDEDNLRGVTVVTSKLNSVGG